MLDTIPDWLDKEAWQAFCEMRKKKGQRAPLTELAAKRIIFELDRMRAQGQDTKAVLWRSVMNGWSGVWPHESTKIQEPPKNVRNHEPTAALFADMDRAKEAASRPEARAAMLAVKARFGRK